MVDILSKSEGFVISLDLVIILYHGTRGKSIAFTKKLKKIFLPSITKKANPNRFLPHFLPHFCRTSTLCRTPAAAVLHPNAPIFPFEKRCKKSRSAAIYRDQSAFLAWSWWTGSNPRPADYKSAGCFALFRMIPGKTGLPF